MKGVMKMTTTCKVFVYGTLKEGGYFARMFNGVRINSRKASTGGKMFSVHGRFPTVNFNMPGTVIGEIHEYSHPEEVIAEMDRIEGYSGKNSASNLYNRIKINVDVDGVVEEAIAYQYNGAVDDFDEITSGEWDINKGIGRE
jgi:gamma-glutamylcyclotransferase (GGCT)/AIG2-like uncharacterized protein YtfP